MDTQTRVGIASQRCPGLRTGALEPFFNGGGWGSQEINQILSCNMKR